MYTLEKKIPFPNCVTQKKMIYIIIFTQVLASDNCNGSHRWTHKEFERNKGMFLSPFEKIPDSIDISEYIKLKISLYNMKIVKPMELLLGISYKRDLFCFLFSAQQMVQRNYLCKELFKFIGRTTLLSYFQKKMSNS